uniref:Strictosidine synthase conserved region domain-containing protein n=1 Tax=Chenopodium quinoa TaxID=63459 RepID=A0A803MAP8_CHEQI
MGVLNVSVEGKVELLTDEVEGRKLKFADGVDIAKDGMIYFTEASYKYSLPNFIFDVFEGKPHGSLLSFDPITKETKILVRDLYFANGVQISADQISVIFCETVMRRCKKYIREGEKQGTLESFADNLPGMPDNIRYDDEGHYWIAFSTSPKPYWDIALRYPFIRKGLAIITRYIGRPHMEKNGGLGAVDLEGNLVAHYYDPKLSMISVGNKIGNYLYPLVDYALHVAPIVFAVAVVLLYQADPFDPASLPAHELTNKKVPTATKINSGVLKESEFIVSGQVFGPEDVAYEPRSRYMYTGCADGWIKRIKVGESGVDFVVEDWVNTGGRPLGIAK